MKPPPRLALALARRTRVLALLALVGMTLPWVVLMESGLPPTFRWLLDLAVHWQLAYAAVFALCVLLWSALERKPLVLWLLLFAGIPLLTAKQSLPAAPESASTSLRVVTANVYFQNMSTASLVASLTEQRADVIVLHEVSPAVASSLVSIQGFPHRVIRASEDPFGMAILSQMPFSAEDVRKVEGTSAEVLDVLIEVNGKSFRLVAAHPMPPITAQYMDERNTLLSSEIQRLNSSGTPGLIAGDLNGTNWSSAFKGVASQGWRSAAPLGGSWPGVVPSSFGIGIDHILASSHWAIKGVTRFDLEGSDHRALAVDLTLK